MFPNKQERHEMSRWCATLIARPDIRMEYGVLLVSEATGIGKTTIASNVLAPLVGMHNTGWPSENDISESNFNEWISNKRLVIVNEIYSGHSWKAYNRLKTLITDKEIMVNPKYQRNYMIDNWAHMLASSNSLRALKMEGDDRRWFYPEVTEVRWPREKFVELRNWLGSGGLGVIKTWAHQFGDYVQPGQRSPMTARKKQLIENSRSEAQTEVADLAESMNENENPVALAMKDIVGFVRVEAQGKVFDSDLELRKAMQEAGAFVWRKRIKVFGRMQYVIMNGAGYDSTKRLEDQGDININAHIRKITTTPENLLGDPM
jgi:hypothetical protein